jgi:hypothetical protein
VRAWRGAVVATSATQVQGSLGFCQTAAALSARLARSHAVSAQCPGGSVEGSGVFSASAERLRSCGCAGPLPARWSVVERSLPQWK